MLSDFQRMYFAQYYANPFPLRKSAVLILLFVRDGRLKTIMIERTDVGVHAGQTVEEIGIEVGRSDVVGELPPVKVPVSNFEISPVVAFVEEVGDIVRSENEVKRVLEVDLADLKASFSTSPVTVAGKQYDVPSYVCGSPVVWGASAMILAELFAVVGEL